MHTFGSQLSNPDLCPDDAVPVSQETLEALARGARGLVRQVGVVRVQPVDLRPARAAGGAQRGLDVAERLLDLCGKVAGEREAVVFEDPAA